MKRTIKREILDQWLRDAYPNAIAKLSVKAEVSASSISKIRNGRIPQNATQRQRLAKAVGVKESELFPVLQDGKGKAS